MNTRIVRFNLHIHETKRTRVLVEIPAGKRHLIHGIIRNHKSGTASADSIKLFEVINQYDASRRKLSLNANSDELMKFTVAAGYNLML
jgi:hypothetical protein